MLSDDVTDTALTAHDPAALIAHTGSPLLVLGAAGSGKTRLILDRYRWLVDQGTMPDRIVLLTPSPARADAARALLEEELRDGYSELVVVTPAEFAASGAAPRRKQARPGRRLGSAPVTGWRCWPSGSTSCRFSTMTSAATRARCWVASCGRIDRLKAELIDADEFAVWAGQQKSAREREFADIFRAHDRMVRELGACDDGDLVRLAIKLLADQPSSRQPFQHVLIDDAQELDLGPATLARAVAGRRADRRRRPAGGALAFPRRRCRAAERIRDAAAPESCGCWRRTAVRRPCFTAAWAMSGSPVESLPTDGQVEFWRCENERAQAQAVAAEIERLVAREQVDPGRIAVIVAEIAREGQAVSVALEERAVPHRVIGDAAFFQRAEVRDVLAWLRLLADPGDAPAVVRALARAPIELRSVDIARCTQIARRRKLDMVAALAAATESPQVPPEARERIRVFLKLYRACAAHIDTMRPDLYVHRLIERLGLRRQQLFAAQADVVERLRALARFGELASAHVARTPQATAREFARSIAAVAQYGLREREEPELAGADSVQVMPLEVAGGVEADHVFVLGLCASLAGSNALDSEPVPDALLHEPLPPDDDAAAALASAPAHVRRRFAGSRAGRAGLRRDRRARSSGRTAAGGRGGARGARL